MKKWTVVRLREQNKDIDTLSKSFANYLYKNGPINDITRKYNISSYDRKRLEKYTSDRIAGILMLYLAKDFTRINDIVNHYSIRDDNSIVNPELEVYMDI